MLFNTALSRPQVFASAYVSLLMLGACGGSSTTVEQTPLPPPAEQAALTYQGPAASTDDVQNFQQALWSNMSTAERCGACHIQAEQAPAFARNDDINLAYSETNNLVDLNNPGDSQLVTKVGGGHNCWLSSDSACADIMTTWISDWASLSNQQNQATQIQLQAPVAKSPGANKNFPADTQLFAEHLHPLLTSYCADCHSNSATVPITPFFSSTDIDEAYAAVQTRVNLNIPADSRIVVRLRDEFHNCWSDCGSDAELLRTAVQRIADNIELTELDPSFVNSNALTLFDGTLASGGGRFETNVIAKWEFKTGSGNTAFDTSGVDPALDLTLSGGYQWVGGYGVQFTNGKAQGATSDSKKLHDLIVATGEFAIEAWVAPANVTQEGPARILSYSGGRDRRNFTLGQTLYNYNALVRTSNTDINGEPALSTADADEDLQAALQHVVVNYSAADGRRIYVNGEFTEDLDLIEGASLQDWDESFALVLGNEVSSDLPWAGIIRMAAIHNRTLAEEEIIRNFDAGIGQKFFLLFGLGDLVDVPQSYIVFEVSQYDSYSYLFIEPLFISLDANAQIADIPLSGMRIGVNGEESFAGQVFSTLQTQVTAGEYQAGIGQALSTQGTIIPLSKGPDLDEFFLTFERLGEHQNVRIEAIPSAPAEGQDLAAQSLLGTRNFAEINASMAQLTTVPVNQADVNTTFSNLKQQLPAVTALDSFVAANQMAVTQLAIEYCNVLIEDDGLRSAYFPDFDFNRDASNAYVGAAREGLINPLLDNILGQAVDTQAPRQDVQAELDSLIDRLSSCNGTQQCDAAYTRTIAKASCAALLGSASLLIQ